MLGAFGSPADMVTADSDFDIPRRIVLYADESTPALKAEEVGRFLTQILGITAETKGDFITILGHGDMEEIARRLAGVRVHDVSKAFERQEASYGEMMFELRFLEDPAKKVPGVLYDGWVMQRLLRDMLPPKKRTSRFQHIVFTSRLIGTFEPDGRYHAHVNLCGFPSIVSTSGVVEAPAKPKEYYLLKRRFVEAGEDVPFELLKERFAGQFIDYDDPRMTEVMKGYALQCALYLITKEAFCDKRGCRLFDAHWQSEVIEAQLDGKLCIRHEKIVKEIRQKAEKTR